MPITWRNVSPTMSANAAANLMRGATDTVMGGLDRLRGAIGTVEQGREDKFDHDVETNTDAFLDQLSQYGSPEELQAAQESGAINRLRESFGARINQDLTRDAVDDRLQTLRSDQVADQQYTLAQAQEAAQPLIQELRGIKDPAKKQEFLDTNADVFGAARMRGPLQQDVWNATEALRSRETAARQEQERKWNETGESILTEFAGADGDFHTLRKGAEEALKNAKPDGSHPIPPARRLKLMSRFRDIYTQSQPEVSPEEAAELEQVSIVQDQEFERRSKIEKAEFEDRQRRLSASMNPSFTAESLADPNKLVSALAEQGITEDGSLAHMTRLWGEVMATTEVDKSGKYLTLERAKNGNMYDNIPEVLKQYQWEILTHAAGGLNAQRGDPGDDGIGGSDEEIKRKIRESITTFRTTQDAMDELKQAEIDLANNLDTYQTDARVAVQSTRNAQRIRRGQKPIPMVVGRDLPTGRQNREKVEAEIPYEKMTAEQRRDARHARTLQRQAEARKEDPTSEEAGVRRLRSNLYDDQRMMRPLRR